jgi:hypothetical protein
MIREAATVLSIYSSLGITQEQISNLRPIDKFGYDDCVKLAALIPQWNEQLKLQVVCVYVCMCMCVCVCVCVVCVDVCVCVNDFGPHLHS